MSYSLLFTGTLTPDGHTLVHRNDWTDPSSRQRVCGPPNSFGWGPRPGYTAARKRMALAHMILSAAIGDAAIDLADEFEQEVIGKLPGHGWSIWIEAVHEWVRKKTAKQRDECKGA
jgi:hypothetical protein